MIPNTKFELGSSPHQKTSRPSARTVPVRLPNCAKPSPGVVATRIVRPAGGVVWSGAPAVGALESASAIAGSNATTAKGRDRKSVVYGKRGDLGGRRIIKKK